MANPIFKTFDIAIPILTPLVNIDQLVSLIAGIPRGSIDNVINAINEINNFLTTPQTTRVSEEKINVFNLMTNISVLKFMRLTTTANSSNVRTTTTKPRTRARYIDWSSLFQASNFRRANLSHAMIVPSNIKDYTQWVKRQKRVSNPKLRLFEHANQLFPSFFFSNWDF